MIQIEYQDTVAVIKLNRGITNAINLDLVNEFSQKLQQIKSNENVHSTVICSSNEKFFSIGFDIPSLFNLSREEFSTFFKSFNKLCLDLYSFPLLTIAAITGHATAGGCILALCCDYRYIAEGRKLMGLNEIKLGIPIPYPTDCILRHLVGTQKARLITDSGDFYQPAQLLQMGIVDGVFPIDKVLAKSIEEARLLSSLSLSSFRMIKRNRTEMVIEQILKHLDEREEFFIESWYSKESRESLKEAIKRF